MKSVLVKVLYCVHPSPLLLSTTKLGQGIIFRSVCQEFCPWGGGCLPPTTPLGRHPPGQTPPWQIPSLSRHPLGQTSPRADTPRSSACWEIRATSGPYTSYWNAYLSSNGLALMGDELMSAQKLANNFLI